MNLYLAALYTSGIHLNSQVVLRTGEAGIKVRNEVEHILESYHYIYSESKVAMIRRDKTKLFLDSGAFSAHSLGADIDIDAYINYVGNNQDIIATDTETGSLLASVLDGIGSAKKTLENQKTMESQGVTPLPCFHFGEPEEYLVHYIDNYPYITLGGLVPVSTKEAIIWLDRLWEKYLSNENGSPRVKVHAFGVTTLDLMRRYPWASVDSSTWVQTARVGNIFIPRVFNTIAISNDSPRRKIQGQHIDTLPEVQRQALIHDIETLYGFPIDGLRTDYAFRWMYNMGIYKDIQKSVTKVSQHYKNEIQELF